MLTCQFEDAGKTTSLRHAVVGMIVCRGTEILLEKRAAHMTCGGMIALPGGYLDRDETIFEAAAREVYEETGFTVTQPRLFLINDKPDRLQDDRQNIEFVILFQAGVQQKGLDHETESIFWADLNHLPPASTWAFDHYHEVELYRRYLQNPVSLPILGINY